MTENEISSIIIGEAIHVHTKLGPGLLESAYKHCLAFRLQERNLNVSMEMAVPLVFENIKLECGYRADLVVESKVIIEIKCVEAIVDIHIAQVLTYLRLLNLKLGLVLNFNCMHMRNGIKRIANGL